MSQGPNNDQRQETLEPGHLIAQLESAITVMRTQQAMIADQQARIEELDHRLEQMFQEKGIRSETAAKNASAAGEASPDRTISSALKCYLSDLSLFSGNRKHYRTWTLEVRAKLDIDGTVIGILSNQFSYLFTRMEPKAQSIVAVYFEKGGQEERKNLIKFLRYFDSVFLDPNSAVRALDRLRTICQKNNESFFLFLSCFEKELHKAQLGTADEAVRISYLQGALNKELCRTIIGSTVYPIYQDYLSALLTIDSQLDGLHFAKIQNGQYD